jgi:hypothetical protein
MANSPNDRAYKTTMNANCRRLLEVGALLLLANDGSLWGPELASDPRFAKSWFAPGEDNLTALDDGHFAWFKAMEEMHMAPMEMLKAATHNIAVAYGKEKELGTLTAGKIADLVILDQDPLQSAEHYRSIHMVIKDGRIIDREALPSTRVLTNPLPPLTEAMQRYRAQRHIGRSGLPVCPVCRGP